jgi:predicted extracellular nuclease
MKPNVGIPRLQSLLKWSKLSSFCVASGVVTLLVGCGGSTPESMSVNPQSEKQMMALGGPTTLPACPTAANTLLAINAVQGSASTSPVVGQLVSVRGVVTGDFQTANQLKGFFIQQVIADKDPQTSEGIFVYAPVNTVPVKAGDYVQVSGKVEEYKSSTSNVKTVTQISQLSQVSVCGTGITIKPLVISLPVASASAFDAYEGMLVKFTQSLTVNDVHGLGQYGEIILAPQRLFQPYNHPTSNDALANADLNARSKIILDDGSSPSNPNPTPYLSASDKTGTRRVGDTVQNVQGILTWAFGAYRVQPTQQATFTPNNPRPAAPATPSGTLKAGSLNVLNYFTTLNSRGANSALEFTRQKDKLVTTIAGLNADVLGLMEIENNASTTIGDLLAAVNAKMGANTYSYINSGKPGTDEIKVAIIYKSSKVKPIGTAVVPTDAGFMVDGGMRPPVAQRFAALDNNGSFWLVVNHLKSKGSCPNGANDVNRDLGQGCWNVARLTQANTLKAWVANLVAQSGEADVLMVGDFNSYLNEDPLASLEAGNYESLLRRLPATDRYSYVFNGDTGALDHAFASNNLKSQVSSVSVWHINADEPPVLDYNTEFKTNDRYDVTPFRSSDHDPVLVGLSLNPDLAIIAPTLTASLPVTAQAGSSTSITSILTSVANAGSGAALSVNWGDGSGPQALPLNASSAVKTYFAAGIYTITLLATDAQGISTQLIGDISITAAPGPDLGSDLFFSEYVEGTSNNKAIEIYNPSANAVDLSIYKVKLYANGATTPTSTQNLTGSIAASSTLTLVHASLSPAAVINGVKLVSAVTNFNGDDAITLEKNGVVIDAIGQVGFDPGAAWTDSAVTTLNATIRRKANIDRGSIPPAAPGVWSLATEWDVYAVDTFTGLGLR